MALIPRSRAGGLSEYTMRQPTPPASIASSRHDGFLLATAPAGADQILATLKNVPPLAARRVQKQIRIHPSFWDASSARRTAFTRSSTLSNRF